MRLLKMREGKIEGINRVVYGIASKLPCRLEWE